MRRFSVAFILERQSAILVEQRLRATHSEYMKTILRECRIPEKVGAIPLHVFEPVFGQEELNFTQVMMPGVIITLVHHLLFRLKQIIGVLLN